jgi:hypothetical protein
MLPLSELALAIATFSSETLLFLDSHQRPWRKNFSLRCFGRLSNRDSVTQKQGRCLSSFRGPPRNLSGCKEYHRGRAERFLAPKTTLLRNWAQVAMFLPLWNGAAPWALSE